MYVLEETVTAPAKVNLFLRVVGKRSDGYHLLDSLMVPVTLYDEIHLQLKPYRVGDDWAEVSCDRPDIPIGQENLACRAARLFLMNVPKRRRTARIHITKRIPAGSGLGGGSSDAAAVLLALNRLLGGRLSTLQLCALGLHIGADVPFFLYGRPARVSGIGDQVTPLDIAVALPLVLCSDGFVLSTKLVYDRLAQASLTSGSPVSNITPFVNGRRPISEMLVNDLETPAAEIYPELRSVKAKVAEQGALGTLMTGSGSAVFGVWPDAESARNAAAHLRARGMWAVSVETLDRSPAVDS